MFDKHPQFLDSRIVVIDDQKTITLILHKLLTETGFQNVFCINDPREAVDIFRTVQPDLILMDLTMPHINGFELLKIFRADKEHHFIPVIVLTSDQDQDSKTTALSLGANDFLPKPFDRAELIVRIQNNLAIRFQYKTLEQTVEERTRELRETQLEIIHRLIIASERRDADTGEHIIRMSVLCYYLGKANRLSEEECDVLRYASTMHDIGKIGIPDHILLKSGKLTTEEFEIMKTHTIIGGEMLAESRSSILQVAELITRTHHEKWDGTGYPRGLRGTEIPLVGRIAAICDVFDALTSRRPYKPAWSLEAALAELVSLKGTHLDPELVDLFIQILPEAITSNEVYAHLRV